MTTNLIRHETLFPGMEPAILPNRYLYKYIMAANGIFIYSKSEMIEALIPIRRILVGTQNIRGLDSVLPYVQLKHRVPAVILSQMVELSREARPNEILFHLNCQYALQLWELTTPPQINGEGYVKSLVSVFSPIEVHSHNTMGAFFSTQDDMDETGFRIYAVLGQVDMNPVAIKVRVSIYGHRASIPYQTVFYPCSEVIDVE